MGKLSYGVYVFQLLCLAGEAIQATVKIMRLPNDKRPSRKERDPTLCDSLWKASAWWGYAAVCQPLPASIYETKHIT